VNAACAGVDTDAKEDDLHCSPFARRSFLQQRFKTRSEKMSVVGKCFLQVQAAHDGNAEAIDDPDPVDLAGFIKQPGIFPVFTGRKYDFSPRFHVFPQQNHFLSNWLPGGGITALQENGAGGDEVAFGGYEFIESTLCRNMPLIAAIPDCNQSHGIQENRFHGWTSSCREARSFWPVS
jgi:hypothetical protein